jgi:hypothetical protein
LIDVQLLMAIPRILPSYSSLGNPKGDLPALCASNKHRVHRLQTFINERAVIC